MTSSSCPATVLSPFLAADDHAVAGDFDHSLRASSVDINDPPKACTDECRSGVTEAQFCPVCDLSKVASAPEVHVPRDAEQSSLKLVACDEIIRYFRGQRFVDQCGPERRADPPDLGARGVVAASPPEGWKADLEDAEDEMAGSGPPKVVSWDPKLGEKLGYEDPPAKKRICGDEDPTTHVNYGILEAQAGFRARNQAYAMFKAAWRARARSDMTVDYPTRLSKSVAKRRHFAESIGRHASSTDFSFKNLKSILKTTQPKAAPCMQLKRIRHIFDTGSGHHLVPREEVKRAGATKHVRSLDYPLTLSTAGGLVNPDGVVEVRAPSLDDGKIDALVLGDTPHVVSAGELCQARGYSFH